MKKIKYLEMFFKLNTTEKFLIVEAFFFSGISYLMIKLIPFKRLAPILGKQNIEIVYHSCEKDRIKTREISKAINMISRHTPWKSKCLAQTLTAKMMLKARKIKSNVYLGVAKDDTNNIIAHSWISSNDIILTGKHGVGKYKIISIFSDV